MNQENREMVNGREHRGRECGQGEREGGGVTGKTQRKRCDTVREDRERVVIGEGKTDREV